MYTSNYITSGPRETPMALREHPDAAQLGGGAADRPLQGGEALHDLPWTDSMLFQGHLTYANVI